MCNTHTQNNPSLGTFIVFIHGWTISFNEWNGRKKKIPENEEEW